LLDSTSDFYIIPTSQGTYVIYKANYYSTQSYQPFKNLEDAKDWIKCVSKKIIPKHIKGIENKGEKGLFNAKTSEVSIEGLVINPWDLT